MLKQAMTALALPLRGTASRFCVAIGLVLAAGAGVAVWGVGCRSVSAASETPMTLDEDRVAALTAELAQVKAATAKLRESQSDTAEELGHIRASIANNEIGLAALRATADENEAHQRDAAAEIASDLARLKDETLHLRMAQDDAASEMGSLRAGVANSEIGVDSLRATTGEISQQLEHFKAARDATGSIAKGHKHHGHKKWVVLQYGFGGPFLVR
jgi:septal ring factor EnvC (AmiA/AmiB activator)